MAVLTIHHGPHRQGGVAEMKRITRGPCVILTWEPLLAESRLTSDCLPHFLNLDRALFPARFRDDTDTFDMRPIVVSHGCKDGFLCAYWRGPEAYLDPNVRGAISTFARVGDYQACLTRLRSDLTDGSRHRKYGI